MQESIYSPSFYRCEQSWHPQAHSKFLDKKLGYRIPKIENKLLQKYRAYDKPEDGSNEKKHYSGTQTWIGLHPQALQTPYTHILETLKLIQEQEIEKIVDIGAGYGRVGFVMNSVFPEAIFVGFEILKERQNEANRLFEKYDLSNCEMIRQNVLEDDFVLPKAQVYFIYDFSEMDDICQVLDQLSERMREENFFLISRGERINFLIEKKYKEFWKTGGFLECGELKIYSSSIKFNRSKV